MSEGNTEQIQREIEAMKSRMTEVESRQNDVNHALVGGLDGRPGMMQNMVNMMNDIYGQNGEGGLKRKVEAGDRRWIWLGGAWAAVTVFAIWIWEAFKAFREAPHK